MTDRMMAGLLLALIVESAHVLKFRWDFTEESSSRAWQFTTVGIALAGVLIFLDETPYLALPNLLTWLPPLLLPMQFIQSFGLRDSLPMSTFSFLAKRRHKRNLRLGLIEQPIHINFGNVYFVTTLISATLGSQSNTLPYSLAFLPGIIVLTGWRLLAASRSRPLALVAALIVAGCISLAGQLGLDELADWFGNRGPSRSPFNPNSVSTMIGRPGKVELSPDIVWRLRPLENSARPTLLRTGAYNTFHGSTWVNNPRITISDFKDLDNIEPVKGEIFYLVAGAFTSADSTTAGGIARLQEIQRESISSELPRFSLRGTAFAESPLPLPGNAASLQHFEHDGIESNSFGTVRIFPKRSVIEGTVLWNGRTNPESPPIPKEDLATPTIEQETLQTILQEIGLDQQLTLEDKLKTLRAWFRENFRYSTSLSISSTNYLSTSRSALSQFLITNHSGHCEYFATATALLLREAGIPTRYAIGYAIVERDMKRGEYVIRGTHGHAWVRVWDENLGKWIDFDTTPPSWLATTSPVNTSTQRFNDALKRMREDFFLWRNRPANRFAATLVMLTIALGIIAFIAKRLWRSKQRLEAEKKATGYSGTIIQTPLNGLERQAEKRLGARPQGQPFADWLMRLRPTLPDSAALEEAIDLHQRLRFDPDPPRPSQRERLEELASQLAAAIRRG